MNNWDILQRKNEPKKTKKNRVEPEIDVVFGDGIRKGRTYTMRTTALISYQVE